MPIHRDVVLDPAFVQLIEVAAHAKVKTSDGQLKNIVNVFHLWTDSPVSASGFDFVQACDDFKTTWWNEVMTGLHSDYSLGFISCRALNDPFSAEGDHTYSSQGSTGGDRLPLDNSVVINWATGVRGRSFQGKNHYGPISESFTTGDILTGSGTTTWQAIRNNFRNNLTFNTSGSDFGLVVLSPTLSDLGATSPTVTWTNVVTANLNITLGTMRRRKEKTQVQPG